MFHALGGEFSIDTRSKFRNSGILNSCRTQLLGFTPTRKAILFVFVANEKLERLMGIFEGIDAKFAALLRNGASIAGGLYVQRSADINSGF